MVCRCAGGPDGANPLGHRIGGSCSAPRCYFHPQDKVMCSGPAAPVPPQQSQDEVHRQRARSLRPGGPGQRQRQLRGEVHRRLQPPRGAGSGGARLPEEEAEETRQRRGRVRGRCEQTEAGGQRAGAGQDAQCEHGLHGAAHAHPHGARGQEAFQDRDAAPGLQLHLAPGQRAAARGGLRGWAAVPRLPEHPARRRGAQRALAAAHLHLLPGQPEEAAQRWREALGRCVKPSGC